MHRPDPPNHDPAWLDVGWPHVWLPYTQMKKASRPLPVVRSEGVRLFLADGRVLIDGLSSWWTACHGYNHPHIAQALRAQIDCLPHVMFGGLAHEPAFRLAQRLSAMLPGNLTRVFFCESGSVSVEIAMKMALQYWLNRGRKGRHKFISFRGGYHGDTLAAMSVCDPEEGMHGLYAGILAEQIIVDLPRTKEQMAQFDRLLRERRDEIAGVLLEPLVQGAGGMRFHTQEILRDIATLTQSRGQLLILDEIMTGFGRTGSLFACLQAQVTPDIITLSKALTGGTLPLAVAVADSHVYEGFLSDDPMAALMHGPTYMANPLGCAAANASLDLFETEPRLLQANAMEEKLERLLAPCRQFAGVREVRAKGAIGVVEVEDLKDVSWLKARFVESGVWVRPFGNIVYLMPPFVISDADLALLGEAVCSVMHRWQKL
jgi:adenosylmethionine-8-amino-7-oxononanoate aminotransferase